MMPFAAMKPELALFLGKFFKVQDFSDPRRVNQKSRFETPKSPSAKSSKLLTPSSHKSAPLSLKPFFPSRSRNHLANLQSTLKESVKEEIKEEDTLQEEQSNFVINTTTGLKEERTVDYSTHETADTLDDMVEQKELLTIDIPEEYHN